MTYVIDANVAVAACFSPAGFKPFGRHKLAAPPLMWSEARSVIRLAVNQRRISEVDGEIAFEALESCRVQKLDPADLGPTAWSIAKEYGWGRTYDAEFVALARLLDCTLVTLDERLLRAVRPPVKAIHATDL